MLNEQINDNDYNDDDDGLAPYGLTSEALSGVREVLRRYSCIALACSDPWRRVRITGVFLDILMSR